jgi:hypothetical protein
MRLPQAAPVTNNAIRPIASAAFDQWPSARLTPSRVELPLMKETNNPPRCRKPMPST